MSQSESIEMFRDSARGFLRATDQRQRDEREPEEQILDRLLEECRKFEVKVRSGQARLGEKKVAILPPDPIGELGSGWEKIQKEKGLSLPVVS